MTASPVGRPWGVAATPDLPALLQYAGAAPPVYGAVDASASHEAGVGGVDHGVRLLIGDVAFDEADGVSVDPVLHIWVLGVVAYGSGVRW